MRIKLDENLPAQLSSTLRELGHDVHSTSEEGLQGEPDRAVWAVAQRESRFLITQDLDFSDARRFSPGSHHGILLVRLRSPSRGSLLGRITQLFRQENVGAWQGCFVVATERKVRVLHPRHN